MVSAKQSRAAREPDAERSRNNQEPESSLFSQVLPPNWRQLIADDPNLPGEDRARVLEANIAVWAIIGYLRALGPEFTTDTIKRAADAFNVPIAAIATAMAYYLEHREAIDARLKVNAAAVA